MAIRVKDAAASAAKFVARAGAAQADYVAGVTGAGQAWQANTAGASENYAAAVTEAISRNAFATGVQRAGGGKYESRARDVGAARFPQGVRSAQGTYAEAVQPYLQVIASLTLPPRQPKGGNAARSEAVAMALRRRKLGG